MSVEKGIWTGRRSSIPIQPWILDWSRCLYRASHGHSLRFFPGTQERIGKKCGRGPAWAAVIRTGGGARWVGAGYRAQPTTQAARPVQCVSTVAQYTSRNSALLDLWRSICWANQAAGQPPKSASPCRVFSLVRH